MRHLHVTENEYILHVDRWSWDGDSRPSAVGLVTHSPTEIQEVRFTFTQTEACRTREECTVLLRHLADEDVELGLKDLRYNFLISTTGTVYEGRGWLYQPSPHPALAPPRGQCIDIAYIGDFYDNMVPQNMYVSGINLIKYGVKMGLINQAYNIHYYRPPKLISSRDVVDQEVVEEPLPPLDPE